MSFLKNIKVYSISSIPKAQTMKIFLVALLLVTLLLNMMYKLDSAAIKDKINLIEGAELISFELKLFGSPFWEKTNFNGVAI